MSDGTIPSTDGFRRSMPVRRCMEKKHVPVISVIDVKSSIDLCPGPTPAKRHMIQMKKLDKLRPDFSGTGK